MLVYYFRTCIFYFQTKLYAIARNRFVIFKSTTNCPDNKYIPHTYFWLLKPTKRKVASNSPFLAESININCWTLLYRNVSYKLNSRSDARSKFLYALFRSFKMRFKTGEKVAFLNLPSWTTLWMLFPVQLGGKNVNCTIFVFVLGLGCQKLQEHPT